VIKIIDILKENKAFVLIFILFMFSRTTFADWSRVPSGSMEPTIYPGDFLLVNKTAFGPSIPLVNIKILSWGHPARGDIITFIPPHTSELFVKRVIGIPGDEILIQKDRVFINGDLMPHQLVSTLPETILLEESLGNIHHLIQYSHDKAIPSDAQKFQVPEGKYFVMGDHRNNSADSRFWGFVDEDNVMGRVDRLLLSFASEREFFSSVGQKIL
jgi:signal peptidase I